MTTDFRWGDYTCTTGATGPASAVDGGDGSATGQETPGRHVRVLVATMMRAVEKLLDLDLHACPGGADGDDYAVLETEMRRFMAMLKKSDAVLGLFADAALELEAHRRLGGRATARSYLRRTLDCTDSQAANIIEYRDTLRPQPDPDPPEDASPDEIELRAELLERRRAGAARLEQAARAGHFPLERSRQLNRHLSAFNGQTPGLIEDVLDTIVDEVPDTSAAGFNSMMLAATEKHLGRRTAKEKSGVAEAFVTVHAPDVNGLCRISGKLPSPTAALFNAAMHVNAAPGMFLDLPDDTPDPRTIGQRRVHALHHILANALAGPGVREAEPRPGAGPAGVGAVGKQRDGKQKGENARRRRKRKGPGDPNHGLLRWVRTDSPWWDVEKCPFVADLFSGDAQPLGRPLPGVASIVVAIRAGDLDEQMKSGSIGNRRFPTNTGIDLTIGELLSLGAHRYAWLAELDDATGRPLQLGRSKRAASLFQRIALLAAETVCTYPGCEKPADECETHHIDDWATGGPTDIDNLTFRCPEHHRENDDSKTNPGCGHATHPGQTGKVGHRFPGKAPIFNDSPAARKSPGWSDSWWASHQKAQREREEQATGPLSGLFNSRRA